MPQIYLKFSLKMLGYISGIPRVYLFPEGTFEVYFCVPDFGKGNHQRFERVKKQKTYCRKPNGRQFERVK